MTLYNNLVASAYGILVKTQSLIIYKNYNILRVTFELLIFFPTISFYSFNVSDTNVLKYVKIYTTQDV